MTRLRSTVKYWLWPLTLPVAAVLWALEPFLRPRFGRACAERIGELAAGLEVTMRRRHLGQRPADETHVYFASGPIANQTLLKMYRRHASIFVNNTGSRLFSMCEPWLRHTRFYLDMPFESREYDLWNDAPPFLFFTPEEEERGREGLRRMGIGAGDWFAVFFTRDPAYLKGRFPANNYAYHNHRNTTIDNFGAAARFIAEQGGFALRLGAKNSDPMPKDMEHPRVIDYARLFRDDFMDVYLIAKSRFAITSDTGLGHLAVVFGVPSVNTNAISLDWAGYLKTDIFIQKHFVEESTGRRIPLRELMNRGLQRVLSAHVHERAGVKLVENTPDEILAATREMHERLAGTWKPAPEDEALQRAYRAQFGPGTYCEGFRSRIGAEFLRRNKGALL